MSQLYFTAVGFNDTGRIDAVFEQHQIDKKFGTCTRLSSLVAYAHILSLLRCRKNQSFEIFSSEAFENSNT